MIIKNRKQIYRKSQNETANNITLRSEDRSLAALHFYSLFTSISSSAIVFWV